MEKTEVVNAIIDSATIGFSRGFILDSWVQLNYESGSQGFGGFVLGGTPDAKAGDHSGPNIAAEWIVSILRAADVDTWSALPGKSVRVRRGEGWGGKVLAIGHITKSDRWFCPEERFTAMLAERAKAQP
jgi:hypothetical protein